MIGVIGFGRFGRIMTRYLAEDFEVKVHNWRDKSDQIREVCAVPVSLEAACRQKLVILSVPISSMREMLRRIAPLLNPDATVVDVCSVKVYPIEWMRDALPESVSILGTHPMFGPDSAAESLHGHKIVLCGERIDPSCYEKVKVYLTGKGLHVVDILPRRT